MRSILYICAVFMLVGCASVDLLLPPTEKAWVSGLHKEEITTDPFVLTVYLRMKDPTKPINIYIEDDGFLWTAKNIPAKDPTPRDPFVLSLAIRDDAANVAYIARPCQMTDESKNPKCAQKFWTDKRFSPEIISSVNQAIDQIVKPLEKPTVHLIGYSGGGALAVLVVPKRQDVASIRTIAGNLDITTSAQIHGIAPLMGSGNPMNAAGKILDIPQTHFVGEFDTIFPKVIAANYKNFHPTPCVKIRIVKSATHEDGWIGSWTALLKEKPVCTPAYPFGRKWREQEEKK